MDGSERWSDGDQWKPTASTVFFGGIHPMVTKKHLRAFCEKEFGPVEAVQIIWDYNTGLSKGYGFVHFLNFDDATKVKSLGNVKFYGRDMDVGDAVLSDRRNKLCKYFFEKGRCMKPNCAYAHSLNALRGELPGDLVGQASTDDALKFGKEGIPPPLFPRASTWTYGDSTWELPRSQTWSPAASVGEEALRANRGNQPTNGVAGTVAPKRPQGSNPASEALGPRIQNVDGQFSIVIPLATLAHKPELLPLLQLCAGCTDNPGSPLPVPLDSPSVEGKLEDLQAAS
eukprot:TRINITY_DN2776_c0_g1_i1.p1 TRINITY_DN2776_c0_g1~~TRINITY_DN2776_c0_g1_i1.p1  ORF type:complete len:292 (-),score=38.81 TRINITY_DN2776_c0_g1_i1:135-989(-)